MTIGIWGDSFTYGSHDIEALGWVGRLRKSLPADGENQVYNFGICGDTSEDLLLRFDVEASAIKPNKIIFAVGVNDSKFPHGSELNKVPFEDFEKNMKLLLGKAKKYSDDITFIGLTRVIDTLDSASAYKFLNSEIEKYDNFLKKLADENESSYVSVSGVVSPATDLVDGIHPNAAGYQKMFEVIKSNLAL